MKHMKFVLVPVFTATALLFVSAAGIDARAEDRQAPMGLRTLMEKLGRDMQAVTGAISTEDWELVEELAPGIARHAEPPAMEKVRILRWVGTDAGKFRGFDAQVEQAANAMAEAAARDDGLEVIRRFSEVQQACLGCHQQFRGPFVEHFHNRRDR
ncbi:cytochrome c [Luteimonas sp. MJ250]|uniref:cytochrome c n=1 Tax=Luteimonas sp. MJ250 TaxID=3129236 RepID=UPI0031BA3C49